MNLTRFVEWWNTPATDRELSVIGSFRHFEEAFAMDADRWDAYMNLRVAGGHPEQHLSRALERRLTPTIKRSFAHALSARADAWAAAIVAGGPSSKFARKPFGDASDFVSHCLRNVEFPLIASPQGVEEVSRRTLWPWLARSVANLSREALEIGWIARTNPESNA
jgi:hypothetical protein